MTDRPRRFDGLRAQYMRVVGGFVCCAVGGVWIAQGSGKLKGSFMTGESRWTVIGVIVLAVGLGLFVWAWQTWLSRNDGE
jgi:hypothetical protein